MNKKGLTTGEFVLLFTGIIVGVVLLVAIFNGQSVMTTKYAVDNETISIASIRNATGGLDGNNSAFNLANKPTPTDWQYAGGCPATGFVLYLENGTEMTNNVDYVVDTTYFNVTYNKSTVLNFGLVGASNVTTVDYTYCQDGYIQDGAARGVTPLIGLFTALALLAFVAYYLKNEY